MGFGSVWAADDGGTGVIARIDLNTLTVTALIPSVQPNPSEMALLRWGARLASARLQA